MSPLGTRMPAAPLDSMNAKKRISAVRRQSSVVTEEGIQERLGLRRQASTVRKSVILESLGKWETGGDFVFKPSPKVGSVSETVRPKSFDDGPLVKEEMEAGESPARPNKSNRAKSADARTSSAVAPLLPKQKAPKKEVGSTSPPLGPKRSSTPTKETTTTSPLSPKRASAPPKGSSPGLQKPTSKRISPKRSSRKIKQASSRSILKDKGSPTNEDNMLEGDDDSKKGRTSGSSGGSGTVNSIGNGGSSVASASSKFPNNRTKRRSSKGPKSAKSIVNGQKPRRSKSSDLEACAEGQSKAKKSKRRAKSADTDVDFGTDILADVEEKSEKSKKKGRTKRRSIQKRASAMQSNDAENDTEGNQQSDPQDRRASMAGNKKRAHSAGPLKRKTGGEVEKPALPERAASMMFNRDNTRRGKTNSLHDLVQYSAEEIHSTSYFASNHVLVNRERMKRGLRPLTRNIAMDALARESAEAMAESAGTSPLRTTYVGNVLRGESIRAVHRAVMLNKQGPERANMLNPYFQDFGVGTAKGTDGMLYVCQLFSERLELSCTDLAAEEGNTD